MGFIEIQCVETGETLTFLDYSTITYHQPGKEPIRVPQGPAWCCNCECIQMAEVFPQYIASTEVLLETAKREPSPEIEFVCGGSKGIERLTLELQQLKAFLFHRTAGPKCLTCFSDHIQIIPNEGVALLPDGKHYAIGGCGFASLGLVVEFQIDARGDKVQ